MRALNLVVFCALSVATDELLKRQEQLGADATSALTCVQNALGGTAAFAGVSSLYMKAETKPVQDSGLRPTPGTREISVVFPDQYRRAEIGRPFRPGEGGLNSIVGFDKDVILTYPRDPDTTRAQVVAHQDFARQMLMRLPRQSAGVTLVQRVAVDSGHERLVIEASGASGLRASLLVDRGSCLPIALQYTTVRAAISGLARVELSGYRPFGGVRIPTLLKTSIAGQPFSEERVTSVEVNTPAAARAFLARR